MSDFTSGPWLADDDYCIWSPQDTAEEQPREQIAIVESRNPDWPANQNLIAAAPSLLAALKALLERGQDDYNEFMYYGMVPNDIHEQGLAAIALARKGERTHGA